MITYKQYSELDFEFWGHAGWFFAAREVEKEIGAKFHADNNMVWILAFDKKKCVGISGIKFTKNYAELKHSYVLPNYRGNGIYTNFSKMRIDIAKQYNCDKIKVTCTDMSKNVIKRFGFSEVGKRGRYTKFEYKI